LVFRVAGFTSDCRGSAVTVAMPARRKQSVACVGPPRTPAVYIQLDIIEGMRPVSFLGDSLKCLRDFPRGARHDAGYQLDKVQRGDQPDDFKPMPAIGKGVEEIRISGSAGSYRVIYVARRAEAVYVLHAFQKKTPATPRTDIQIARKRLRQLLGGRT